ncbi:hypothetical protein CAP36_02720 [Chitinophagaceae bacterium IBVUCB2]|nr:hypothetical protein CAP36_02720 [Chitinophagaceae bacterium IBVUCB2]
MKFSTEGIIFFAVLSFGGSMIMLIVWLYNSRQKKIIKLNHLVTGKIVDVIERRGLKGNKYYESVIKYQPFSGSLISVLYLTSRKPRLFAKGDEIALYYNPAKPEKYVLKEDSRARSNNIIFGTIGALFFAAAICALFLL